MQSIATGDAVAFTLLYDRHCKLLYSVALHMLSDPEEARDVLQQVFLKVVKKSGLYLPSGGKVSSWLCTLTRNQSLDRLRQIKSKQSLRETFYVETVCLSEPHWQDERFGQFSDEVELLEGAMAELRPDERQVLKLAYFGGYSQTEIAEKLSQPLGSVKARIRRSLAKLRASLEGVIAPVNASEPVRTPWMSAA